MKQILYYISTAFFELALLLFRALYLLTMAPNFKTLRTVSNTIYFMLEKNKLFISPGGGGGPRGGDSVLKCMRGTNE